jgi:hypothetical protein
MSAAAAKQRPRKTAPVQQNNRLFSAIHAGLELFLQSG